MKTFGDLRPGDMLVYYHLGQNNNEISAMYLVLAMPLQDDAPTVTFDNGKRHFVLLKVKGKGTKINTYLWDKVAPLLLPKFMKVIRP